jgi:hypothetical protein
MLARVAQAEIAASVWRTGASIVEPFCTLAYIEANPQEAMRELAALQK